MINCIAFDLSRLFIGPMTPVPRGIDRVDIAYARHFLEHSSADCFGVLPTPWGVRWFNRDRSLRVLHFAEEVWCEATEPDADPTYHWIKDRLLGQPPSVSLPRKRSAATRLSAGLVRFIHKAGFSFGKPIHTLPRNAIYLNTGQLGIAISPLLRWLALRKDVRPVFMLHDAIPIDYPEYTPEWSSRAYQRMLINTTRYARGLIVTTDAAASSIRTALARLGGPEIPALASHLPVSPRFEQSRILDPDLRDIVYFVVCGAIDPRKNHLLLLNIWRELVCVHKQSSPKLVIIGSRWRTSDAVANMLDRCSLIKDFVIEIGGLSTPALRQILSGARALLMPSFAEGFGIPIVEALAVGTPVIASNLAAHREVGCSCVTYLSPLDGVGWLTAIQARAVGERSTSLKCTGYRRNTSVEYFKRIEEFMASL